MTTNSWISKREINRTSAYLCSSRNHGRALRNDAKDKESGKNNVRPHNGAGDFVIGEPPGWVKKDRIFLMTDGVGRWVSGSCVSDRAVTIEHLKIKKKTRCFEGSF
jgi:hypothetical protein